MEDDDGFSYIKEILSKVKSPGNGRVRPGLTNFTPVNLWGN